MHMGTLRIARRKQYVNVDARSINDDHLSFRARGVLVWLLEKPNDWRVDSDLIATQGKEGRDAIRAAMRELEAAGYLVRRKVQTDGGRWITETVVYEHPDLATDDWKTGVGKPDAGSPGPITKTSSNEEVTTEEETQTALVAMDALPVQHKTDDEAFETFWKAYPRKTAKAAARKVWDRAVKASAKQHPEYAVGAIIDGAIKYAEDPNRVDEFTAHATTWLNQERWNDPPLPQRGKQGQRTTDDKLRSSAAAAQRFLGRGDGEQKAIGG